MDSESEDEGSRAGNKRKKKAYGNQEFLSVGEAMVDVEQIRDASRIRAEEREKLRFEAEMQQRDQHHQFQMGKQVEILLRLRLELQKQEQKTRWGGSAQGFESTNEEQPWLE